MNSSLVPPVMSRHEKTCDSELTLREKLLEIERIEKKHNLLGLRFALKECNTGAPTTAELVDLVRLVLDETVSLSERFDSLPRAERYPPV
jgi:hypothetical protein